MISPFILCAKVWHELGRRLESVACVGLSLFVTMFSLRSIWKLVVRKIIHIDMDCFYAAIEMRDNPHLEGKPIAVGGTPESRSVLCTSNYVARQYGVRSAMASAYALRLCPALIILPVNMAKYREVSTQIRALFFEYTDLVEPLSLDEAYLDVSECQRCSNSATLIAKEIRQKIFARCGLTASAGVAPIKFLAKIASDLNKPNGQYIITPSEVDNFIKTLPVNKIFGVGAVTAAKLGQHGIETGADLQKRSKQELMDCIGKFGGTLYQLAQGIDERPVATSRFRKSISVENTFPADLPTLEACIEKLPALMEQLQKRLSSNKSSIYKQFVKVKFNDFVSTTAETIVTEPTFENFIHLLGVGFSRKRLPVRLLGVGVGLKPDSVSSQYELNLGDT